MASKKFLELSGLSVEDLKAELVKASKELEDLTFDHAISGLENPMVLRSARRDRARIITEIRRREVSEMSKEEWASRDKIRHRRKKKY